MTKVFLAAGVAALAIAAPATAERGGGRGDKGQSAQVERGGGGGQARAERREARGDRRQARVERREARPQMARSERRAERRAERPQRAERQQIRMARAERGDRREARVEQRGNRIDRQQARSEQRGNRIDRRELRAQRGENRIDRRELRAQRVDNRGDRRELRAQRIDNRIENRLDRQEFRAQRVAGRMDRQTLINTRDWNDGDRWFRARGLASACPPGLDKKDNGCLPPGQARTLIGNVIPATYRQALLPVALRDLYRDDDDYYYRYGDGYLYQVNRQDNLIASLLPLFTGGYMVGQSLPSMYMNSYVPDYYRPFYADTNDDYYRYANGYIYEIDASSGLIEDIDPAYGYGYGVGQLMPTSYSYYNVPYQYRDMYYDTDDYYYRYAPGAIYQVDRGTSLITAVASLLAGDLGVGNRLPMGYDVYNVPMAYRSQYYDTPDAWYRYNDGYIYQVDPTTRLITAVVSALV